MDVDPGSGVCLAVDIRATCFFPLDTTKTQTWVYAILLAEGYNTYRIQKEKAAESNDMTKVWKFKERVSCVVSPYDVLAGVPMNRRFENPQASGATDIQSGTSFQLDSASLKSNWRAWMYHSSPLSSFKWSNLLDYVTGTVAKYVNWSGPYSYHQTEQEQGEMREKLRRKGLIQ